MKIFINGEEKTIASPCSVQDLLMSCGMANSPCAVEVNAQLVPKRSHADHQIQEGDRVEVVTLVGGG